MNRRQPGIRRLLTSSRGTNLLEAALVLPLLVLITLSIIEFGAMFYAYLALENGVSQATRFGITGATSGSLSREDSIMAAMRDATPTLTIADSAFTFDYLPQGGSTWLSGPGGPGDIEKVTVNYTYDFMTPLIRPFFTNGQLQIQVSSAMKTEGRFNRSRESTSRLVVARSRWADRASSSSRSYCPSCFWWRSASSRRAGLLDDHIVTTLSREGSNLISRDTTIQDATTAIRQMATAPVNIDNGSSTVIFSVIKNGARPGTANYQKAFLYQRYVYGTYPGTSQFTTAGIGSFGGAPNYLANNPDTDASLQITNAPSSLVPTPGSLIYVTEIFSHHLLLTPLDRFGVALPTTLSSIAFF